MTLRTRLRRALPAALCDLAGFAGCAMIGYGAWLVYEPAGFVVFGGLMVAGSALIGARINAVQQ